MIRHMTSLALSGTVPQSDAHIVFIRPKGKGAALVGAHKLKQAAKVNAALAALGATGSLNEMHTIPSNGASAANVVIAVGLGNSTDRDDLRHALGNAIRSLVGKKKAVIAPPANDEATVRAVVESALMAAYAFDEFRTEKSKLRPGVKSIVIAVDGAAGLKTAVDRAEATAHAVNATRDLANTPPGHLPPAELVARALTAIKGLPVKSHVLDEKQLRAGGYGGIVGVGQGAQRPPRLLRLEYRPKSAKRHIAFVGKGITFDTGGISLKPPLGMSEMKADMAGAAAVIQATVAIARLGLPVKVTTYAAIAENMPGSMAQRPGDVVTTYSGKTVEVLNTDAEGRMVLCDALTRVQEDKPDVIIDVATLTGACAVALGPLMSAILTNDPVLAQDILRAASEAGEHFWELPLPKMYRNMLDSKVADLANVKEMSPPAKGGTLVGGLFLQEFIEPGQSWAHLDIAPPAFNSGGAFGYTPTGSTGTATRTLIEYAHLFC